MTPEPTDRPGLACRACGSADLVPMLDLGMSPLCESFLAPDQLDQMEPFYPLAVSVCAGCFLVQLPAYVQPEAIFGEYAYFSSYSDSWLHHAERYAEAMIERFGLDSRSSVVEAASNDGYLLQYFVKRGIPAFGIEPAANVAKVAIEKGVPTVVQFLNATTGPAIGAKRGKADLLIGNNVLAQVPDVNGFLQGCKALLKPAGVVTMECPHLARLIEGSQFDTIYHEHFSYFSLLSTRSMFARQGLTIFDVEELPTHGGSLRVYGCHTGCHDYPASERVGALQAEEQRLGLGTVDYYLTFRARVHAAKRNLLSFLIGAREAGKRVAGYGAPGKGNTLLNYCGIRSDMLEYTVDRNPYKQGKFLPGTHIPIYHPDKLRETRPDYVLIIPWNLKDEIAVQLAYVRDWGGRLVVPIPATEILP